MRNLMLECAFALGLAGMPVFGQCEYDLAMIPGRNCGIFGQAATIAYDINDAGDVVGDITCVTNTAFRWREDVGLQPLDLGTSAGSS